MPHSVPGPTFALSRETNADGDDWDTYFAHVARARSADPVFAAARAASNAAALAMELAVCGPRSARRARGRW